MNDVVPPSKKLYVLIKWKNNDYTMSLGVIRSHWIRGFNLKDFWQRDGKKVYVVDWRRGNVRRVFKADVLDVNESKAALKEKQVQIADEEILRNRRKRHFNEMLMSKEGDELERNDDCKHMKPNINKLSLLEKIKVLIEDFECGTCKETGAKVIELQNTVIELQTRVYNKGIECQSLRNEIESLQMLKNDRAKEKFEGLSAIKEQITRLSNVITGKIDEMDCLHQSSTRIENVKQVEVYEGSGVYCSETAWMKANTSTRPTMFVRRLLVALFDDDTLKRSSIKGGVHRSNKKLPPRPPLDPKKILALTHATQKKYPGTLKSLISQTISLKILSYSMNHQTK